MSEQVIEIDITVCYYISRITRTGANVLAPTGSMLPRGRHHRRPPPHDEEIGARDEEHIVRRANKQTYSRRSRGQPVACVSERVSKKKICRHLICIANHVNRHQRTRADGLNVAEGTAPPSTAVPRRGDRREENGGDFKAGG